MVRNIFMFFNTFLYDLQEDYDAAYRFAQLWPDEKTVCKIIDQFMCNYIYFRLPDMDEPTAIVIGPYLTADPTHEEILGQAEKIGTDPDALRQQEEYYASLPVFNDPSAIFAVKSCLGEVIWGGPDSFHMRDVNYEEFFGTLSGAPIEQTDILQQMKTLEERYAYENELMEIVSKGQTSRAELMMSSVSQLNYQHRAGDPLRNMKNYCIICNTLLRKAAQNGGVHPFYLDQMSGQYARRIETSATLEKANSLIGEMIRGYCRLVHTHTGRHFAAAVQKTMAYIDANLSSDLSLSSLAKLMRVSPGYLSTLFHKETGVTLAEHITKQRMKAALQLLKSTRLQIQTVAQLSGFSDPNYFGKQFKRYYGLTPQQYRKKHMEPLAQADM